MYQDKITGAFHFQGDEDEDALRYVWTLLMDLSFKGRVETILRILFKRPPIFVGYKKPEHFNTESLKKLNEMAGR